MSGAPGDELPELRPVTLPVRRGDVLVLATDGVDDHVADDLAATRRCGVIARRLLEDYARPTDDALGVVAPYLGNGAAGTPGPPPVATATPRRCTGPPA